MTRDFMNYHVMMENALRGVIREALKRAFDEGLAGDHHFYITFDTSFPGVVIPDHLQARFKDEMTIVLQHQFWGLEVRDEAFAVTLSFSDLHERLVIPFDAVTAFADPSVQFGLQFTSGDEEDDDEGSDEESASEAPETKTSAPAPVPATTEPTAVNEAEAKNEPEGEEKPAGNVVTLDAFRKK